MSGYQTRQIVNLSRQLNEAQQDNERLRALLLRHHNIHKSVILNVYPNTQLCLDTLKALNNETS